MARQVLLYIAASLDGYIAKQDGNIEFLNMVEQAGEDYGHAEFTQQVDTIIWGRKTFDKVLSIDEKYLYRDKNVYVISRQRKGKFEHINYRDDVVQLINELKQKPGKNIYCDGGGEIVYELLQHDLLDTIIVSVIPHLLGDGVRLFKDGRPEQGLKFKRSITYPSGLVQLWYSRLR